MLLRTLMFMLFIATLPLHAQWQSIGNVDSVVIRGSDEVMLRSGGALLLIKVITPEMVRVRLAPQGLFRTDMSYAVVKTDWPRVKADIAQTDRGVAISTTALKLVVSRTPLRLQIFDGAGTLVNEDEPLKGMAWTGSEVRVWKRMPQDEYYFGFGEKAGRLQKRPQHTPMWNSDIPAYRADTDPIYQSHPFFYGLRRGKAYGIFLDNPYRSSFDMGVESPTQYSFGASDGELNYYFIYGPGPKNVLTRYTELVGRMPLPPRWSLGYQQCRWSYPNEKRVREIASGFRSRKMPCDVIYLDIDYMDGYRIFTWNTKNFPEPKKMIDDLARDGFRIAVIVDPGIKSDTAYAAYRTGTAGDHFVKMPDGRPFIGKVWPGECAFPDFTSSAARRWWGENFSQLVAAGVRGWWNDMNEPSVFDTPSKTIDLTAVHDDDGMRSPHAKIHNVYGLLMTRATYEGVRNLLPTERPFVLTRASFSGGHRYSAAWTGDNVSSWDHLQMSVPMCLNLGISGQPFVGADIGGFIGYPSGELFARWLQLGVFTPLMRAHSVINEKNKEPWEYGEEYTRINRETLNLRYQLLPYIYNVMHQSSVTGMPAMRPLIFEYPADENYIENETEFMLGDDMLVAPVLQEGARKRELRLPQGEWYDYWTGTKYTGGQNVTVDAPLNRVPVFVKAGAIIPTQQLVQYSEQSPIDPLTFTVFPAPTSSTMYYEDDGRSFDYLAGEYFERSITQTTAGSTVSLTLGKADGSYTPPRRSLVVRFASVAAPPHGVAIDGKPLERVSTTSWPQVKGGWYHDSVTQSLFVRLMDEKPARTISFER